MGTSKPVHAGSEPGLSESRVSQTGRKSSRSRNPKAKASKNAGIIHRYQGYGYKPLAVSN